jgi:hypothetical protein
MVPLLRLFGWGVSARVGRSLSGIFPQIQDDPTTPPNRADGLAPGGTTGVGARKSTREEEEELTRGGAPAGDHNGRPALQTQG